MLTIIPADTEVIEAARLAATAHLHLITDGRRTCLSPVIPQGWTRLGVTVRTTEPVAA
jgi:hypothetical protein